MTAAVKLYIQLAGAVILGLLLMWSVGYVRNLQKKAAVGEQRGAVIETTAGVIKDAADADTKGAANEAAVSAGQGAYRIIIEEGRRNEPSTRVNADSANPPSVLDAARARRLARERSAGVPDSDAKDAGGSRPVER